ncbi:Serine/threonine-protein kinase [Drechslerella dactyloides]|uniref:Serine/threonine-protein kinase n=1 Tax=Drechslerella dactyloides TaxID=74499 RepID=A0AAD6IU57_DREDA|nr:Serine/threonine-protein kinase [Drechslerella dactyloides]
MEALRDKIQGTRTTTVGAEDDGYFIEFASLDRLLTDDVVSTALENTSIESFRREGIKKVILAGGKQTFAILISIERPELIYDCIEHHDTGKDRLDSKLPLSFTDIDSIFGAKAKNAEGEPEEWAKKLEEGQYEYIPPSFQRGATHRVLRDRVRLPFKSKERLGGGGFGIVYKVTLSDGQHDAQLDRVLVLKELGNLRKSRSSRTAEAKKALEAMFKEEQRCLEILRVIKHPNILELLFSYTHKGKNCFLFPLARGGDLQDFLDGDSRTVDLAADEAVYHAFCGLSSALESLHSYINQGLKLEMVGCHHDLKPKNILVDGPKFILSDFGLSQMRSDLKDYRSTYQSGEGFYIAPECEDLSTFEKLEVGRPSDVWSFGCILTNTLVYLKEGKAGVKSFEAARKIEIQTNFGPATFSMFHAGRESENTGVAQKLSDLEEKGGRSEKLLIQCVRDMLKLKPGERPPIEKCSQALRCVAISAISESVEQAWADTSSDEYNFKDHLEFQVEKVNFEVWTRTVIETSGVLKDLMQSELTFKETYNTLGKIKAELRALEQRAKEDTWFPLFVQLRHLMNQLLSYAPKDVQRRIHSLVESIILQSDTKSLRLSDLPSQNTGTVGSDRILMLAAIKHMKELASVPNPERSIPQIPKEDMELDTKSVFSTFYLADYKLSEDDEAKSEKVLVEDLIYDKEWQADDGKQLFERMENVLRIPDTTNEFKALQCRGYCHDQTGHRFALVYRFPHGPGCQFVEQLIQLFDKTKPVIDPFLKAKQAVVSLEHRFQLAYKLAESIFEFHKIGWLHKAISSYNVVFFAKDERHARKMESPYLTGFSHSRPDQVNQISVVGSDIDEKLAAYHHPDYQRSLLDPTNDRVRYRAEFDYYSLGLVLLEIAYWVPLRRLLNRNDTISKEGQKLLTYYVQYLSGPMGANYASAVKACLDSKALRGDAEPTSDKAESVEPNFERYVLEKLRVCSV